MVITYSITILAQASLTTDLLSWFLPQNRHDN